MDQITNKLSINLLKPGEEPMVYAVQGEFNARKVEMTLYCDEKPWRIPDGANLSIRYGRVNMTGGYYDTLPDGTSAWEYEENRITLVLAPQMMAVAGLVHVQVEIRQENAVLCTFPFRLNVSFNPAMEIIEPEDYINMQQWMKMELDTYIEQVKECGEFLGGTMAGPINMNGQRLFGLNLPREDTEAATKGYTLGLVKKTSPRNLLDNSDFRNPVNQRGFTYGIPDSDNEYFIDRWLTIQSTSKNMSLSHSNEGLTVTVLSGMAGIRQYVPRIETDLTCAIKVNGEIYTLPIKQGVHVSKRTGIGVTMSATWEMEYLIIDISATMSELENFTVVWAALYMGEYTNETLPEYQPKGYATELMECLRYYMIPVQESLGYGYIHETKTVAVISIPIPIKMRTIPRVKFDAISVRYSDKAVHITDTNNAIIFEHGSNSIRLNIVGTYEVASVIAVASASNFAFDADIR